LRGSCICGFRFDGRIDVRPGFYLVMSNGFARSAWSRGLERDIRGVDRPTGFEAFLSAFGNFIIVAFCSSLGRESGRSIHWLLSGGRLRVIPPTCGFPAKLRYAGGLKAPAMLGRFG